MSDAQQRRFDREMLRSMSASLSSGLAFSFNPQDMAEVLSRAADIVDPKPKGRADLPATDAQAMQNEKVKALVEATIELIAYCETGAWPSRDPVQKARAALAAINGGQDDE